jgi:hypothetical protein
MYGARGLEPEKADCGRKGSAGAFPAVWPKAAVRADAGRQICGAKMRSPLACTKKPLIFQWFLLFYEVLGVKLV